MNTRRIVYFANASIPSSTANSVHIMKMCEALTDAGHAVVLLVPDAPDPNRRGQDAFGFYGVRENFQIDRFGWARSVVAGVRDVLFSLHGIWRIRARFKPSVCITRHPTSGFLFPLFGIPTILELHTPLGRLMGPLMVRFGGFSRARLLRVIVISENLRRHFRDTGCPEAKILVLHDAVNPEVYRWPLPERAGDRPRVGYIGSLYSGKGMEVVFRLAILDPEREYHVFGGNPDQIALWSVKPDFPANLILHGHVPNARVPELLETLDVVLMPYQRSVSVVGNKGDVAKWMSPMKMFEYMAAGKAIVSSDLDVLREVLVDGKNALLVPPDDIEAWKRAVDRLFSDASLRQALGRSAREEVMMEYTWTRRASRMLAGIA